MSKLYEQRLTCVDCGAGFIWTVGEQEYFRERQHPDPPKRCKECRRAKRKRREEAAKEGGKK